MRSFVVCSALMTLLFFAISARATEKDILTKLAETPQEVISVQEPEPAIMGVNQVEGVEAQDVAVILNQLPDNSQKEILISTDSEAVTQVVADWSMAHPKAKAPNILFLGRILKDNPLTRLSKRIVDYKDFLVDSARKDKIGIMVTTINTIYDSFLWIHATQYSIEQRSAMILMNLMMTLVFSIDKDNWARILRPLDQE